MGQKRITMPTPALIAPQLSKFIESIQYDSVVDLACKGGLYCTCFPVGKYLGVEKTEQALEKTKAANSTYRFTLTSQAPRYADLYFAHNILGSSSIDTGALPLHQIRCKYLLLLEHPSLDVGCDLQKHLGSLRHHDFVLESESTQTGVQLMLFRKVFGNRR